MTNTLWAETFVDELARGGLQAVVIAPGSRSTPLTLAFAAHPAIRHYLHLDERSAAFFALGLALATTRPVALLCTSGTAGANYFPAIIEARMSQVPLLVLTSDRPPELRHSGANQTIDQVKLYGDQVLWAVDVALPEADPPAVALRNLRTLAARALATAAGLPPGPVHLNFPFRKPLEPALPHTPAFAPAGPPHTRTLRGQLLPTPNQIAELAALINQHERGLIVCGPRCEGGDFPAAVAALAQTSGYPLLADPLSGVRFGQAAAVGGYDTFLRGDGPGWPAPEVILRFGHLPVSKWLNEYLARQADARLVHVQASGVWADDSHRVDTFLQADGTATCRALAARLTPRPGSSWAAQVQATEAATWVALDRGLAGAPFFDGAVVADLLDLLPAGAQLLVGNSLPIRHVDQFGRPSGRELHVYGNRGASGIDGNLSTGLGLAAAAPQRPTVILVGDITFYHDMNGLLAVRQQQLRRVTVVLLNNNGGGIFRRLPIAGHEPPFTELFLTPHGLDFAPAGQLYGLAYQRITSRAAFRRHLAASLAGHTPTLLEAQTDGAADLGCLREVVG